VLNISKIVKVTFSQEAEEEYKRLVETVKEEKENGIKTSEHQKLLKSIDQKVDRIKFAPDSGIQISRKLFPTKYLSYYEINNLWKMNLVKYWRLIYTMRGDRAELLCFVLDIINHKEYDKIFKYKKR